MDYQLPSEEIIPKTVKELDPDQQPREKAEKYGCAVLSVPELWALILRTGLTGLPITDLCRNLMRDNDNSLHRLERRTRQELRGIKGIGPTKSVQVEAVMELIKRYCQEDIPLDESITDSSQIFNRMKLKIGNLDHEEVWVLFLNRRNQVVKEMCMTIGTSVASLFDVKKILKMALLENAEGVILCHNHPSGGIQPSPQDKQITLELKKGCDIMKLRLLDHVIVTATRFFSFHDNGLI
ncbi:MAG: DNA repair protein RadC [Muribaculaceae bacterium]|nr:DNA repair protein RadC [Muribaculaceae bacterium]